MTRTLARANVLLLQVVAGYIAFDVLGFIMWALSGQLPVDSFYIGSITAHALGAII